MLPRAHGSALFQRGETQALVTVTLGTGRDEQRVDGLIDEYCKKFMLDYNFPSFSVGEVPADPRPGPPRDRPRRAGRAQRQAGPARPRRVPLHDPRHLRHPRVERLQLDGLGLRRHARPDGRRRADHATRSPASRSAWSRKATSGSLLTDIIGDEDHFGDMDFKVAGTQNGITGIQLDLKIDGISEEIIRDDARPGPRGPAARSSGRCSRRSRGRARRSRPVRPAADPDPDRPREDRPAHRPRRQDDPRHPGRDRRQDRHRGRRHRDDRQHATPPGPRRPATRSRR